MGARGATAVAVPCHETAVSGPRLFTDPAPPQPSACFFLALALALPELSQTLHEQRCTLRPDAEVWYSGPGDALHAFLEYDRGQASARRLAAKVDQYYDFRAHCGADVTVLLITPGLRRATGPLVRAWEIAQERRVPLLDLRATTVSNLTMCGLWAPIWKNVHGVARSLDGGAQMEGETGQQARLG